MDCLGRGRFCLFPRRRSSIHRRCIRHLVPQRMEEETTCAAATMRGRGEADVVVARAMMDKDDEMGFSGGDEQPVIVVIVVGV